MWPILGIDILEVVEESRQPRKVHSNLNSTFLALIPKSEHSEEPQGFRPISLWNFIYKIISNIMVDWIKPLLLALVSLQQTVFVKGCQILNGIVTAQEAIHSLKSLRSNGMMIKINLLKSHDRLSWTYLIRILQAYNIDSTWIQWRSSLISSSVFSILLNGSPTQNFNASRGLTKGDQISHLFFILAVEELGRYIKSKTQEGHLKGLCMWEMTFPSLINSFLMIS